MLFGSRCLGGDACATLHVGIRERTKRESGTRGLGVRGHVSRVVAAGVILSSGVTGAAELGDLCVGGLDEEA